MSMDQTIQPTYKFKKYFKSMIFNDNVAFIPTLLVSGILLAVLYMMYLQGYSQRKFDKVDYSGYSQKNATIFGNLNNINNYSKAVIPPTLPLKLPEPQTTSTNNQIVADSQASLTLKADYAKTLKQGCETLIKAKGIVQFEPRTNYLNARSKQNLDALMTCFKEHKITISGHTDSIGTVERKAEVSQLRAATVQQYLIQQGIPSTQLTTVGMSDSQPLADNGTTEGRLKNRRIEFMVESLAR
jgi:outer membrane protein OmpA-like peptidoglycan-associated protein